MPSCALAGGGVRAATSASGGSALRANIDELDSMPKFRWPIESDRVDQVNLMVLPVILGTGEKAFEQTPALRELRLRESKVVGDGVLVLIYGRAA